MIYVLTLTDINTHTGKHSGLKIKPCGVVGREKASLGRLSELTLEFWEE